MMIGISMRSPAIFERRALSSTRSGEPGAYMRTGSFTGFGTRRFPLKPTSPPPAWTTGCDGVAGTGACCSRAAAAWDFGGLATGADMTTPLDDRRCVPLLAAQLQDTGAREWGQRARPST